MTAQPEPLYETEHLGADAEPISHRLNGGRGPDGRFAPGGPGGPGRPPRAVEDAYLEAFFEVVPPERWKRILEKVAHRAELGTLNDFLALSRHVERLAGRNA